MVQTRSQTKKLLQQQPLQDASNAKATKTALNELCELMTEIKCSHTDAEKIVNLTKFLTYIIHNIDDVKNINKIKKLCDLFPKKFAEYRRSVVSGKVSNTPLETLMDFFNAMDRVEATIRHHNIVLGN